MNFKQLAWRFSVVASGSFGISDATRRMNAIESVQAAVA
jgi:hypothetical protein